MYIVIRLFGLFSFFKYSSKSFANIRFIVGCQGIAYNTSNLLYNSQGLKLFSI